MTRRIADAIYMRTALITAGSRMLLNLVCAPGRRPPTDPRYIHDPNAGEVNPKSGWGFYSMAFYYMELL
jgi:hypothetical protein